MSTYVLLSEDEPIVDLVSQIEAILHEHASDKTKEKDVKSPSVNTPEENDEEDDEEEEKEKDEDEEKDKEKDEDEEKDKSEEEEEPSKKKQSPKAAKKKPVEPKPKEDSAWMILAKENKTLEVLDQAFFPNFQKFLTANEAEAESLFYLAFYILHILAEKNKLDWRSRVTKLTTLFSSESKDSKENDEQLLSRLRWFGVLHDSFHDEKQPDVRYATFIAFLSFISWSKQTGHVIEQLTLANYEKCIKTWKLTPAEQREFSLLLTNVHVQHQTNNKLATPLEETQKHRIQYLKTFETVTKGDDVDKATEQALGAIVHALLFNSLVEIHTLLTLRAVTNLSKHKDHSRAHRLLTIFAKESCEAYEKFYKENPSYLSELGLNHKKLQSHIRTLTLCSLGAASPTLSYETLQKAFGVPSSNEVEEIVLDAVVEGRVEAKVDQEKSEVVIYRTSPRSFELSSWQSLSDQLESWKENVSQVLSILQRAQQQQQQQQTPAVRGGKIRGE